MAKARIVITTTLEYEIDENNYPDSSSLDDCLKVDIQNAWDDPCMFVDMWESTLDVNGEIISE